MLLTQQSSQPLATIDLSASHLERAATALRHAATPDSHSTATRSHSTEARSHTRQSQHGDTQPQHCDTQPQHCGKAQPQKVDSSNGCAVWNRLKQLCDWAQGEGRTQLLCAQLLTRLLCAQLPDCCVRSYSQIQRPFNSTEPISTNC